MRNWLWSQIAIKDAELAAQERGESGDVAGAIQSVLEDVTPNAIMADAFESDDVFPEPGVN